MVFCLSNIGDLMWLADCLWLPHSLIELFLTGKYDIQEHTYLSVLKYLSLFNMSEVQKTVLFIPFLIHLLDPGHF
jgi:hypothetical protein